MRSLVTMFLLIFGVLSGGASGFAAEQANFPSTIPVVDMRDFQSPETKQKFIDEMSKALHEVGFFAVVNPGVNEKALAEGYDASKHFFQSSLEKKNAICKPELNGQRGYIPSEIAQGRTSKDCKEFLHIGSNNNVWPAWMDLQYPMEHLISTLEEHSEKLQQAMSLAMGQPEGFLSSTTRNGNSLLRALHYPSNPSSGQFWAAAHTDIDLFTILPMATEEGLQIYHNGEWVAVRVPPDAFIINGGDMLENMTNGYFKSSRHRVVAKENLERYSIVYFIHPRSDVALGPIAHCISMTGGKPLFPEATRDELLFRRLVEIGLASDDLKKLDAQSGLIERVESLVKQDSAAPPVQKTYAVWQQMAMAERDASQQHQNSTK